MKFYRLTVLLIILSAFLLTHCAAPQPSLVKPLAAPQAVDLLHYKPKVDNFLIILDASASMTKPLGETDRLDKAKTIIENISQTLPAIEVNAALRTFGHSASVAMENTTLMYGPAPYTKTGLTAGLDKVSEAGGNSFMGQAIEAATEDLATTNGYIALIILSDGYNLDGEPVEAASRMKTQFGERLCIYTIQVGGADGEPGGVSPLMAALADIGGCGTAVSADRLASNSTTAEFVTAVFLAQRMDIDKDGVYDDQDECPDTAANVATDAKGCPLDTDGDGVADYRDKCPDTQAYAQVDDNGCPLDSDSDGVADYLDKCPNTVAGADVDSSGCPLDSDGDGVVNYLDKCPDTPKGTSVDYSGCAYFSAVAGATITSTGTWVFKDIQFSTDSDVIDPKSFDSLDKIADELNRNPKLKLEIQGHTDSAGSMAYNTTLSEKRAKTVEKYLLDKGVSSGQVNAAGYGPTMPIASNDTPGGRATNRRVEFKAIQ